MTVREVAVRYPVAAAIGGAGLQFVLTVLVLKAGADFAPPEAFGKVKLVAFASTILLPILLVQLLGMWKDVGLELDRIRPAPLFLVSLLVCVAFLSMGVETGPGFPGEASMQFANAFGEELLFRGVIFALLLHLPAWRAIVLNGVLFGSMHLIHGVMDGSWTHAITLMAVTTMSGMMFAAVRMRTGSLWLVILLHMLLNLSILHSSAEAAEGTAAMVIERTANLFEVALAAWVAWTASRRPLPAPPSVA